MRELWWMARASWDQIALLAMLLAEPNRNHDEYPRPYTPDDFNPYAPHREEALTPGNWIPHNEAVLEQLNSLGQIGG